MNALGAFAVTMCYLCVGVSLLSFLTPQKRTRHMIGLVLGIFVLTSAGNAVSACISDLRATLPQYNSSDLPDVHEQEYVDAVAQLTADQLVVVTDELLRSEGIIADDIRLVLKIGDDGRIYVSRADIYISEKFEDRIADIERVVYRNLSKEPDVYVQKEES